MVKTLTFDHIMYRAFVVNAKSPYEDKLFNILGELGFNERHLSDLIASKLPDDLKQIFPAKRQKDFNMTDCWYKNALLSLSDSVGLLYNKKEFKTVKTKIRDEAKYAFGISEESRQTHLWHLIYLTITINVGRKLAVSSDDRGFNIYSYTHCYTGGQKHVETPSDWETGFSLVCQEMEYFKELMMSEYG